MREMKHHSWGTCLLMLGLVSSPLHAQNGWESSSADGFWKLRLATRVITEAWLVDQPAPGVLDFESDGFLAPRIDLMATASVGEDWSGHMLARWDRGFDPGTSPGGEMRLDEAFLRWQPFGDARLQWQIGKFATVFGGWPNRHDFWDSPFLSAPLPYSRILGVSDTEKIGPNLTETRRDLPDDKANWVPMVWGPSYSLGTAILASSEHFDFALEIKNSSLSSRPEEWDHTSHFLDQPTVTARLGWRPDVSLAFGLSGSHGGYLRPGAERGLQPGKDREDFTQSTIGLDAHWAWHHLMIHGEVLATRFDTPGGYLDTLGWYLEARQKLNARAWLALRFGQQFSSEISRPSRNLAWERDAWRMEAALGYRLSESALLKLEYGYTSESGDQPQGEHSLGLGLGYRF